MKVYLVTTRYKQGKKHKVSKITGFVGVFAWENAQAKAASKYPYLPNITIHMKG